MTCIEEERVMGNWANSWRKMSWNTLCFQLVNVSSPLTTAGLLKPTCPSMLLLWNTETLFYKVDISFTKMAHIWAANFVKNNMCGRSTNAMQMILFLCKKEMFYRPYRCESEEELVSTRFTHWNIWQKKVFPCFQDPALCTFPVWG